MSSALCPYCKKVYVELDGKCVSCNVLFPWVVDRERLRDEMKEREPNRVRATITLVQELFGWARGEGPPSIAAVRGLVFAWLFPRALIVLGSVIGGLALLLQTWILWNQTALLKSQAVTAQMQQQMWLRDRVTTLQADVAVLSEYAKTTMAGVLANHIAHGETNCDNTCREKVIFDISLDSLLNARSALIAKDTTALKVVSRYIEEVALLRERLLSKKAIDPSSGTRSLDRMQAIVFFAEALQRRCNVSMDTPSLVSAVDAWVRFKDSDMRDIRPIRAAVDIDPQYSDANTRLTAGDVIDVAVKLTNALADRLSTLQGACEKVLARESSLLHSIEQEVFGEGVPPAPTSSSATSPSRVRSHAGSAPR
jgi:hypothetical protein